IPINTVTLYFIRFTVYLRHFFPGIWVNARVSAILIHFLSYETKDRFHVTWNSISDHRIRKLYRSSLVHHFLHIPITGEWVDISAIPATAAATTSTATATGKR